VKQTVTLATVVVEFLERPGLALSTKETYSLTLGLLLQEYGSWAIEIISRQTLVEYLNTLTHLKYTTHNKHQAILQSLFNFAVEQGYIKSNPIRGIKQRPASREKGEHRTDEIIRFLTPSQLEILYQAVGDDRRLNAIVHLLHHTGCRIGELLALNIESVDLNNWKFQVLGKGNKQRWCFYNEATAIALNKYINYDRHKQSDALFTAQHPMTMKVSRMSYRTLHDYWREITNKHSLIQGVRIHDLRHTFATERVGIISIEQLRALMGHESIQTTLRYQKVTSQKAEEAARLAFNLLTKVDKLD
jgi:integrase/recombinase XerD